MADGKVYGGSEMTGLHQNDSIACSSEILGTLWIPTSSPSFQGSKSLLNFENVNASESGDGSYFQTIDKEESNDEEYDGCDRRSGKKRRLKIEQVQFLERNFEVENKLEPERKIQLAKEAGLEPRQVAIWFQNRRARFKTKQMEKDYGSLKASYDKLMADYDLLLKENDDLKSQVNALKEKLLTREKDKGNLELNEVINSSIDEPQKLKSDSDCNQVFNVPMLVCKQEDASSAKSDVFDSDSPRNTENHSSLIEPADSCHVFEPDQSDFSQDHEEDNFSRSLFPPCFLKLEDCYDEPPSNSCSFGFAVDDQPFCFWPYLSS